MRFSICIPAYEYNGYGSVLISRLLESVKLQTFKDYEIVISDQSDDLLVKNIVNQFDNVMNIHYIKTKKLGKLSYNINQAIKNSNGEFIKPMWMDDLFLNENCLLNISNVIDVDTYWGAVDFIHLDDFGKLANYMIPKYTNNILQGNNKIGGPSTSFFKNDNNYFDENLIWFMDCDMYYRLNKKTNGIFINSQIPNIISSIEKKYGSITNTLISEQLIKKEESYLKLKYNGGKNDKT